MANVQGLALALFLLAVACFAVVSGKSDLGYSPQDVQSEASLRSLFGSWSRKHGKAFLENEVEDRFEVFKRNVEAIHAHNAKPEKNFVLAVNEFAHLTQEEFKKQYLGFTPRVENNPLRQPTSFRYSNVAAPDSIDWRELGAVGHVKNQGQCGSCWAFSAIGAVEGINQVVTGDLVTLSEQELVDCDKSKNMGCSGGLMDYAFEFIIQNGGIDTDEDYPYLGYNGQCDGEKEGRTIVSIDDYEDVPSFRESSLMQALAMQPVSVAVEADEIPFQFYNSGIMDGQCGTALDHGVLAVGYGSEGGVPYWIVKNSWGAAWGEAGYIRLRRGMSSPYGQCGILMQSSFPIKSGPNPPPGPPRPPAPTPQPEVCDTTHQCQAGTTCCCSVPVGSFCLAWGCCPMAAATCCDDHRHCCPHDYPVCRLDIGLCIKGNPPTGLTFDEDIEGVPPVEKTSATIRWPQLPAVFGRKAGEATDEEKGLATA